MRWLILIFILAKHRQKINSELFQADISISYVCNMLGAPLKIIYTNWTYVREILVKVFLIFKYFRVVE